MAAGSRGGRREGAGRPRVVEGLQRRNIYLDQRCIDLIDQRQRVTGETFSEAIRNVIVERFER